MLYYTRGILGNVKGSLSGLSFFNWKGINLVRAARRKSEKPPTELQIYYRACFVLYSDFYKRIRDLYPESSFRYFSTSKNYRISFMKLNLIHSLEPAAINFESLIVAYGDLTNRPITTYSVLSNPTRLRLRFSTTADNIDSFANDITQGFIFNMTRNQIQRATYLSYRTNGWIDFIIPAGWLLTDNVFCYYWFKNFVNTRLSTSLVKELN